MANSKDKLHIRSFHNKPYDFNELAAKAPEINQFIVKNVAGVDTLQFANPKAVYFLNKALLLHFYGLKMWNLSDENLVPPIPGRADYIHYLADLLQGEKSNTTHILDIGTGASLIYPIIGNAVYKWKFTATDIDLKSIANAQEIIDTNPHLKTQISLRFQADSKHILSGIITTDDKFSAVMCNPPFFKSKKEAEAQTTRKLKGLGTAVSNTLVHNFSGKNNELWCVGGELLFVKNYIKESFLFKSQVDWFTCLISNQDHLKALKNDLQKYAAEIKVIEMAQGNKKSRILAWRF